MKIIVDNKTFAIGILSLTAVAMLIANLNAPRSVKAAETVKGRDYQMITARTSQGDDGLYVVDNRTGLMAMFMYDTRSKRIEAKRVKPITDAFAGTTPPHKGK